MTAIQFDTATLLRLLERAALFTDTDDTLPHLMCVRLDYDGAKTLTAWATDRYTAARVTAYTAEFAEPGPAWSALVRREDIALIGRAYKAGRRLLCEALTVTRREHQLALAPADVQANGNPNRVVDLAVAVWTPTSTSKPMLGPSGPGAVPQYMAYPDLPSLFDQMAADGVQMAPAAVNPRLLARFAKAADRWTPIQIEARGVKAMRVRIGDDFTGLIMPVQTRAEVRV